MRAEAEKQRDLICSTAEDQIILLITNANPPPFSADPHIKAWVTCLVKETYNKAEIKVTEQAIHCGNEFLG